MTTRQEFQNLLLSLNMVATNLVMLEIDMQHGYDHPTGISKPIIFSQYGGHKDLVMLEIDMQTWIWPPARNCKTYCFH